MGKFYQTLAFSAITCMVFVAAGQAQDNCITPPDHYNTTQYPNMKQRIIAPISVGGTLAEPKFRAMFEYTPAGYNPGDLNTLYPVIIYFPGLDGSGSVGSGDACYMLYDAPLSLPARIEKDLWQGSVTSGGHTFNFIVLSFQYWRYNYPGDFPSDEDVDDVIDYALANYRIDPSRVYLTGMSAGANLVVQYIGSSVAHAQRIAGASISSTCSTVGVFPNSSESPAHIADAGLATYFIHCETDDRCNISIPNGWINGINAASPSIAPQFAHLQNGTALPCSGFGHNTWDKLYDPSFTVGGLNLYQWQVQYQASSALPVLLKNFDARLQNGKVYVSWTTSAEWDAGAFTLERAGASQQYAPIATIPSHVNSASERRYEFVDENPLSNLSYYRLRQTDLNGRSRYFEVKRIMNQGLSSGLVVAPNPFGQQLSAFINVSHAQRVTVELTDMNGRRLHFVEKEFAPGTTELALPADKLSRGIYLLRVHAADFSVVRKLVRE